MRRQMAALTLAALLLLPGCSAMLNREYQVVSPHPEFPATEENSSAIRVETYQELVNAVLYFVEQGVEHGVVRLVNYTRDVESDLSRACLEVAKEDPLGAYAVDFIKNDYTRVVTTYEATIDITYRRTPEQLRALVNVTGSSAIRQELAGALSVFAPEIALRVGYFAEDEASILALVRQAYCDTPAAALGMPDCTVSLYPETGRQRIVEILLSYPGEREVLQKRQAAALAAADRLAAPYQGISDPETRLRSLAGDLSIQTVYDPERGGNTIWDALVAGRADGEGLALALLLLGERTGLSCTLAEGRLNGAPHVWNVLELEDGTRRHIDLSGEIPTLLGTDEEWAALGYGWLSGGEEPEGPDGEAAQTPETLLMTRSGPEKTGPGPDGAAPDGAEPPGGDGAEPTEEGEGSGPELPEESGAEAPAEAQ